MHQLRLCPLSTSGTVDENLIASQVASLPVDVLNTSERRGRSFSLLLLHVASIYWVSSVVARRTDAVLVPGTLLEC